MLLHLHGGSLSRRWRNTVSLGDLACGIGLLHVLYGQLLGLGTIYRGCYFIDRLWWSRLRTSSSWCRDQIEVLQIRSRLNATMMLLVCQLDLVRHRSASLREVAPAVRRWVKRNIAVLVALIITTCYIFKVGRVLLEGGVWPYEHLVTRIVNNHLIHFRSRILRGVESIRGLLKLLNPTIFTDPQLRMMSLYGIWGSICWALLG